MKDGDVDPCPEASSAAHSGESATAAARRMLTSFVRATTICDRAAKAAQTTDVASQAATTTSASGIATGESDTTTVRSAAAALALMEVAQEHVEAAHAQLVAVTIEIERSFSDNG